jgi:hypothetical protein
MKNKILIIGAGLGGLALAQGLVKAGFHATVFERDESPASRPQGYRISIRSLGMQALSALLTPEKLSRLSEAKVADVGDGFTCANEKMEPFFSVPQGQDAAVQFLRTELRSLLQEGIDIKWNKRLSRFEDNGDQVVAHFEDGSHAAGDLLVGCDGGGSSVRELLPSVYGNSLGLIPRVFDSNRAISEATFETFSLPGKYNLVFIPSGSFGHLITQEQVDKALAFIVDRLNPGSKIVMHVLSRFDPVSRVDEGLFRYELWESNEISKTEVEDYRVRYYEPAEIESLLHRHGLETIAKWQAEPHTMIEASDADPVILFECVKK